MRLPASLPSALLMLPCVHCARLTGGRLDSCATLLRLQAAVVGVTVGRTRWPGSSRTVEGSAAAAVSFLACAAALSWLLAEHTPWPRLLAASIAVALVEAVTQQIDNLLLPLVAYAALTA